MMAEKDRNKEAAAAPLTGEDAALWDQVAETAKPLRKGKNRVVDRPGPVAGPAREESGMNPGPAGGAPRRAVTPPPPPASAPALPAGGFDRREARALGSGRAGIDGRIDLHGMRQREAHGALRAFLARAQERGHKHVLVITGKGGRREPDGSFERGVLNREVPRWLCEPEFRSQVVSFTPAHKRHGGEGALYVRLRKRGKPSQNS
ncbi:hypothetical protein BMS3Bbin10_01353 [bacterium BMS3Bbin10]|nr:hypothetical protein BMS3Bbin10_01353 [bacterium BMS3Bbin10]